MLFCLTTEERRQPPLRGVLKEAAPDGGAATSLDLSAWPLSVVVRRPTSSPRLVPETFGTTLAVIALVQLAWIALWLIEQRW